MEEKQIRKERVEEREERREVNEEGTTRAVKS